LAKNKAYVSNCSSSFRECTNEDVNTVRRARMLEISSIVP
jgi:hypothetical protein